MQNAAAGRGMQDQGTHSGCWFLWLSGGKSLWGGPYRSPRCFKTLCKAATVPMGIIFCLYAMKDGVGEEQGADIQHAHRVEIGKESTGHHAGGCKAQQGPETPPQKETLSWDR